MPAGGYQRPTNPAPVSGPGALSRRTDGGPAQAMRDLPNAKYGENAEFRTIQAGAPMAAAPSRPAQGGAGGNTFAPPAPAIDPPTPLTADTSRPDEPVTHGAALGPGANGMALPDVNVQSAYSTLQRVAAGGSAQAQALLARLQNGI